MNSGPGASILTSRLLAESPLLLAAVVGIILAAVMLRHSALLCTIFGCAILLLGTVTVAVIQSALFESRISGELPVERFANYSNLLGIGTGLLRAVAFGLVLAAALIGRSRPRR